MKLATFAINGKQHVGALTEQGLVPFAGSASDVADVIRLGAGGVRLGDLLASALPATRHRSRFCRRSSRRRRSSASA